MYLHFSNSTCIYTSFFLIFKRSGLPFIKDIRKIGPSRRTIFFFRNVMFICLQAVWSCWGRQILFWRRNQMWKVRKVWENFFVQIYFTILDFLCHTLLCFDFDSSRDPQHSASVQLVVNSNYPWSSLSNTAAHIDSEKLSLSKLEKIFTFNYKYSHLFWQKSLSLSGFKIALDLHFQIQMFGENFTFNFWTWRDAFDLHFQLHILSSLLAMITFTFWIQN